MGETLSFLAGSNAVFLAGSLAALALSRRPRSARAASSIFSALGCLILLGVSPSALGGPCGDRVIPGVPVLGGFRFGMSPLSALFEVLIAGLGLASSIFAWGYAEDYDDRAGELGFFYGVFLAGMSLVFAARSVFAFLFSWEIMTLSSYFLVVADTESQESRRAGWIYFVMSQGGAAFLLAGFFLLGGAGGLWDFAALESAGRSLAPSMKGAVFLLFLAGFGTKAGLVPLHLWLPEAHPAAPSHVSSLMSGGMIKTGVYGIVLAGFSFLGAPLGWWGVMLIALGAASALVGVLYALVERDLKKLLAYSSIENVGVIAMILGAALLFASSGRIEPSLFALSAALFHALNHAAFKGLLFMGAGAAAKSAGTRDMEKLGGLLKRLPFSGGLFLVGVAAASALPPLNGFASEWAGIQALLSGFVLPGTLDRIACLAALVALALAAGLAASAFVRGFGVSFLALPRSPLAAEAREVSAFEIAGMAIAAAFCVLLGLGAPMVFEAVTKVAHAAIPSCAAAVRAAPLEARPMPPTAIAFGYGSYSAPTLFAVLLACALAAWLLIRFAAGAPRIRRAPTWACGLPGLSPRMEYSATAYAKPFRMLFSFFYRPIREVRRDCVASPYFPSGIHYASSVTSLFKEKLYRPAAELLLKLSGAARRLQAGDVNLYLGYLSATLTGLLLLAVWRLH